MADKKELLMQIQESLSSLTLLVSWQHQLIKELQEVTATLLSTLAEEASQDQ